VAEHPASDADVPRWWAALGLPGLIDSHVHFLPERVQRKVWGYFASGGPLLGRPWPVVYRSSEEHRLATLRALGVRGFPSLVYAHRPGMAAWLNRWAAEFADRVPECLRTATFYAEPGVFDYVTDAVSGGVQVFKVHVQVGDFDPADPILDPVWGLLADAGLPVVVHAGNGPVPGRYTGPAHFARVLARHPRLPAVIAHLGMPDYAAFLDVAERYPNVRLDTTMAFTPFTEQAMPFPADLRPRLRDLSDRILFGSDFPSIPYPYAQQLAALAALGLGDAWLRAVCYQNAAALFGIGLKDGVGASDVGR
jgi:predicted TIM-barrel fold metal-dependent hydrolase